MKVIVHKEKCQGHAVCILRGPDVFEVNDEGYNVMDAFDVPLGLEQQARKGVAACPELAIEIIK
jgi:ferredoxin